MATGTPRTVTVQEMAELLGISRNHAFRCVQRGEIPSVRIGRRVLIPAAFLERLLDLDDREATGRRTMGSSGTRGQASA